MLIMWRYDYYKFLNTGRCCQKMLIVKKYCKLIKKCNLKGNNISKKLNFTLLPYDYQIDIYKVSTDEYQKYNILIKFQIVHSES